MAKAMGRTNFRYAQYINRLHGRSGHLWQNRFFSCALDEVHCWRTMAYVERNPVRARVVRKAWRYPWSSALAHTGEADRSGLLDMERWRAEWRPTEWKRALEQPQDEAELSSIRLATHRGRPLASDRLLSKMERRLGRPTATPADRPTAEAQDSPKGQRQEEQEAEK